MVGGDRLDRLRQRARVGRRAHRGASSASYRRPSWRSGPRPPPPGTHRREEVGRVEHAQRDLLPGRGAVHGADARAVALDHVGGHADPAVVHAERLEHLVAHVGLEAAAVEPPDDLGQDRHPAGQVVSRPPARDPVGFALDRADAGDGLVPVPGAGRGARHRVAAPDPGGVREQVPEGDRVLAVGAELGHVPHDRVVELERAALPLLRDRHRDAGLGHREPDDQGVGRHRRARAASPTARSATGLPSIDA